MNRILLLAIYMLAALPASAEDAAHDWKAVPGRPDVLVDMASIGPSHIAGSSRDGGPPDTDITVMIKGDVFYHFWIDCKSRWHPADGSIPVAKLRAMVCPTRHSH